MNQQAMPSGPSLRTSPVLGSKTSTPFTFTRTRPRSAGRRAISGSPKMTNRLPLPVFLMSSAMCRSAFMRALSTGMRPSLLNSVACVHQYDEVGKILQAEVVVLHVGPDPGVRLGHATRLGFPVAVQHHPVHVAARGIRLPTVRPGGVEANVRGRAHRVVGVEHRLDRTLIVGQLGRRRVVADDDEAGLVVPDPSTSPR